MKLPTKLGRLLLEEVVAERIETGGTNPSPAQVVAAFQRMALVTDFEESLSAVQMYFKEDKRVFPTDGKTMKALRITYDLTKKDVLGHAVDAIMQLMDAPMGATKDKLAAAAVINELFGEKELIKDEQLTDRLLINLASKAG